jgi:predicted nuclease of predicted toxin-antitoxin system
MSNRYFLDENIESAIARVLEGVAVAFVRCQDTVLLQADDPDILHWTAQHAYVVVSHDRDTMPAFFWTYVGEHGFHPGLIIIHEKYRADFGEIARYIRQTETFDLSNQVWWYPALPPRPEAAESGKDGE